MRIPQSIDISELTLRIDGDLKCTLPPEYDPTTSDVTGFLIDLDGTMYRPGGLIPGAKEFFDWLVESKTPHVFLSNTEAKGSQGVQNKFLSPQYKISDTPLPLKNIWTASEAQINLMMHKKEHTPFSVRGCLQDFCIPDGAKVFVVGGGDGIWLNSLRMRNSLKFDSWDIRISLTEKEAKYWAFEASKTKAEAGVSNVYIVMFCEGKLDKVPSVEGEEDISRSTSYNGCWNYELIRDASFMIHQGAHLIYTSDDAFNPSEDPEYPGMIFPLPGPGMFASMLSFLSRDSYQDEGGNKLFCSGKGGNYGDIFMMEHAINMLKSQGHDGDRSKIMMVGDRFDTDIRGGSSVGIQTCLVQSGAHLVEQQANYENDRADWTAMSVASLVDPRFYYLDAGATEKLEETRNFERKNSSNWQLGTTFKRKALRKSDLSALKSAVKMAFRR